MKLNPLYYIDYLLDRVTMYRLVLYILIILLLILSYFSVISVVPYSVISIVASTFFLIFVCYITNVLFAKVYAVPANSESFLITALILALIISPAQTIEGFIFLGWAGVLSMASKYILAVKRKHIFNPAAIAVVITALTLGETASWWVGTIATVPFVAIGGFLLVRKLHYEKLVLTFIFATCCMLLLRILLMGSDMLTIARILFLHTPLLFFAGIMLTEPLTLPPTKKLQIVAGGIIGVLISPLIHIGNFYLTPELALVFGNIFAYAVSPKEKLLLTLKEKNHVAPDIIDFVFSLEKPYNYTPGQYMEWTLPHRYVDSRGNRRYFTLTSSPTEDTLRLGVKFYHNGSSYKESMKKLDTNITMLAGSLAGSFTLPKDKTKKLVFIAGGIGVTPFRSMIKYLVDMNEKRDIVHFFANKYPDDVVYTDVFDEAEAKLGIRTIYTITDTKQQYALWKGHIGRIDSAMIQQEVPDWKDRTYYLSGPHVMVTAYKEVLVTMGVGSSQIITDFFPGLV